MLKRNTQVIVRFNKAELQQLQKRVKKSGLSQEAYIREVLAGSVPREVPPVDYYGMTRQLSAIGNRLNQIAARANATGFFLADEYEKTAQELRKVTMEIKAAVTSPERKTQ